MRERTCQTCGFWSQWLPSLGDCMLKPYTRRHAIVTDAADRPPQIRAHETAIDETCAKWAPVDQVREFVHGGKEPETWAEDKAGEQA